MELSPTTIERLRDEAYAMLCRCSVLQSLERLEQEKATLASTRPPFGFLAPKQTRDAFEHSMRAATGTAAALDTRLGQIIQLEQWLQGMLHDEIHSYLTAVSPDFRRFAAAGELIDRWQIEFRALPELLLAFARDVKNAAQQSASNPTARDLQFFAILRDSALRVEKHLDGLDSIVTQIILLLPSEAAAEVRMPALPDFRRVGWVNQIAAYPAPQLLAETNRVELEARQFVAHGHHAIPPRLDAAREAYRRHEELFLQNYWNQLRAHAQAHYVEERDVDEVINDLMQRYVTSDLARRQRALVSEDPFLGER